MYNKKAFSLLLFLLYLALFSMITVFVCHVATTLVIPSLQSVRKCQEIIAFHIATDLFVRDIHAIRSGHQWKLTTAHELIWHQENGDIGWSFHQGALERKEGIYDNGWKKVTTSIIAKGAKQAVFNYQRKNDRIVAVELTLTAQCNPNKPIICYVSIVPGEKT